MNEEIDIEIGETTSGKVVIAFVSKTGERNEWRVSKETASIVRDRLNEVIARLK